MNLGSEPLSLDWNLANDYISFDIISNIMMGLTRFGEDEKGNIISIPGCAKTWDIDQTASKYHFYLDPECKWTDGRQVYSQDFIDSFARAQDPKTAAPYADLLSIIDLEKSKAISNEHLYIELKNPAAYFIYLTSYGLTLPIRKDLIEKYGNDWTEPENLVTNGIFKLKEWQHEYKIILERKDWNTTAQQAAHGGNEIRFLKYFMISEQASAFTLFENKQIDWIDNRSLPTSEIKNLKNRDDIIVESKELLRNTYIGFNNQNGPFQNRKLRQAFAYAINRNEIVKTRAKGDIAGTTWIPASLGKYLDHETLLNNFKKENGFKPSLEEFKNGYFPELARNKLREAGYSKDSKELEDLLFLIPNKESNKMLAETLQAMWQRELGITVKINAMEWKVFLARLRDNPPDLFRLNWGADYPDPDTFTGLFSSNNQINYEKFSNLNYDRLIKNAAASTDTEYRKNLYTQAETILTIQDMGLTPIFVDSQTLVKRPYVKGLRVNSMDIAFLDQVKLEI